MSFFRIFLILASALAVTSCAKLTLAWADLKPDGDAAVPPALGAFEGGGPVAGVADWEARKPALREALEREVYGTMPDGYALHVLERKVLDEEAFDGLGRLVEFKLKADVTFGEETRETRVFYMDVIEPSGRDAAPVILMQTYCPRRDTIPHPAITHVEGMGGCGGGGIGTSIMTYVFGRYIATPPLEEILQRGYALATIYPSEFAPDSKTRGLPALKEMSAGLDGNRERWGAVAAWAWGFSLMIDALEEESGAKERSYITWGHSRYGKSALLAAAFDDRIAGVISHQSGTGGASLNRRKKGESVRSITAAYPHWFTQAYADYAGHEEDMGVDQHQLLALIAPRPILVGNARRDVWSDPNGAFRAAIGADPVYELLGSEGLEQTRLDQWKPDADIAFWIRAGTHGVVKEDWPAFFEFLDAHFPAGAASQG